MFSILTFLFGDNVVGRLGRYVMWWRREKKAFPKGSLVTRVYQAVCSSDKRILEVTTCKRSHSWRILDSTGGKHGQKNPMTRAEFLELMRQLDKDEKNGKVVYIDGTRNSKTISDIDVYVYRFSPTVEAPK